MHSKKIAQAVTLSLLLGASSLVVGQVTISVNVAPPELPVYDQPPIPGDGYVWTPGYWAWSDDEQGYYWVPGTWIEAPQPGFLWTPGYWGWSNGAYLWNAGYWGPHVGFYGGVNYGFGYTGVGYQGGYWQGDHLYYNRAVVNVGNVHVTNVYNRTVVNNVTVNRVSFNGGSGGINARPTAADEQAAHDRHIDATGAQREHVNAARQDTALRASENHGRPAVAASAQPGHFTGNVMGARNAADFHEPARNGAGLQTPANHNAPAMRRDIERSPDQGAPHASAPPAQHMAPRPEQQRVPVQPHPEAPQQRPAETARPAEPVRPAEPARAAAQPEQRAAPQEQHAAPPPHANPPPRPSAPEGHPQPHPEEHH